jgi:hypothetical protein
VIHEVLFMALGLGIGCAIVLLALASTGLIRRFWG